MPTVPSNYCKRTDYASGLTQVSQVLDDSQRDTNNNEVTRNKIPTASFSQRSLRLPRILDICSAQEVFYGREDCIVSCKL